MRLLPYAAITGNLRWPCRATHFSTGPSSFASSAHLCNSAATLAGKFNDCRPSGSEGKFLSIKLDPQMVCLQVRRSVPAAHVSVGCTSEMTAFRLGLGFKSRTHNSVHRSVPSKASPHCDFPSSLHVGPMTVVGDTPIGCRLSLKESSEWHHACLLHISCRAGSVIVF
jgi:hypothetical protein